MLKNMFLLLCVFFFSCATGFAQEEEYIGEYASCKELLKSPYIADMIALGEQKCLMLSQKESQDVILLSENDIFLGSNTIHPELKAELKKKYYRGQKLGFSFSGSLRNITPTHISLRHTQIGSQKIFTPESSYTLKIGSDTALREKKMLTQYCQADSFLLQCEEGFYKDIQTRIDTVFRDILLRGENLFTKDEVFLETQQKKIQKIRMLYQALALEYKNSQKILYLLESIDYKLSIYESMIENTLSEKKLNNFLASEKQKMKGNYYTKLGTDMYIFTEKLYIYFYIGNTLVNTIQNDLSHFSPDEIQKHGLSLEDRSLLAYHLIEKYSLVQNPSIPKDLRVLEKKWLGGSSYIILSPEGRRYALEDYPKNIYLHRDILFAITQWKNNSQKLLKSSTKTSIGELYSLPPEYSEIVSAAFSGKSVELTLKKSDGNLENKYISY